MGKLQKSPSAPVKRNTVQHGNKTRLVLPKQTSRSAVRHKARQYMQHALTKGELHYPFKEDNISPSDLKKLWEELSIHQIELDIKNEELRQQERNHYAELFDLVPIGYFTLDEEGVICAVNLEGVKLLGCEKKFVLSHPFIGYLTSKSHPIFLECMGKVIQERKSISTELTIQHPPNNETSYAVQTLDVSMSLFIINEPTLQALSQKDNPQKNKTYLRMMLTDISERKQTQNDLSEAIQRLEIVLDGTQLGVWETDLVLQLNWVDVRWAAMLGYTKQEIPTTISFWLSLIHPNDLEKVQDYLRLQREGRFISSRMEFRMRAKDGNYRWIQSQWRVVQRDEDQKPTRIIGTHLDITERKETVAALRHSEERYRQLFESSPVGIWEQDFSAVKAACDTLKQQGVTDFNAYFYENPQAIVNLAQEVKILHVNQAGLVLYGATTQEDLLINLDAFLTADGLHTFEQQIICIAQGHNTFSYETSNRNLLGEAIYIYLHWATMPGYEDSYKRVMVVTQDFTARRLSEEALYQSEERFRIVAELTSDYAYELRINPQGEHYIAWITPSFEKVTGYCVDDLLSGAISMMNIVHAEDHNIISDAIEKSGSGAEIQSEYRIITKDQHIKWVRHLIQPKWSYEEQRIVGIIGTSKDITAEKEAQINQHAQLARNQHQNEFINRIALSNAMLNGDIEKLAQEITATATDLFACERVSVWLFNMDETELHCLDLFEQTPQQHSCGLTLREDLFRDEFSVLKSSAFVDAHDVLNDERVKGYIDEYLKPNRISSMLDVVIRNGSNNLGLLCIEHVQQAHTWQAEEIAFATHLTDHIVVALLNRERIQSTAALVVSEQKYRQLVEQIQEGIWTTNVEAVTTYINARIAEKLGYASEEMLGTPIFDYMDDERKHIMREKIKMRKQGVREEYEFTFQKRDGSPLAVIINASPIITPTGEYNGSFALISDLTERKQMEASLREREERLSMALQGADLGVWDYHIPSGRNIVDERWAAMLGYTLEEIPSSIDFWLDIVHPHDLEGINLAFDEHALGLSPLIQQTVRARTIQGKYIWIYSTSKIVERDNQGKPLRMIGVHQDVNELKQAQIALQASESRYRNLFESIQEGFALHEIILDAQNQPCDYRFLDVNPTYEAMTGLKREQLIGKTVLEVLPKTEPYWIENYGKVAISGEPITYEDYSQELDKHFLVRAYCPGHNLFATLISDISRRKKAEETLRAHDERLEIALWGAEAGVWEWRIPNEEFIIDGQLAAMLGYSLDEIEPNFQFWINLVHPDDVERVNNTSQAYITGLIEKYQMEYRLRTKEGDWKWLMSSGGIVERDERETPMRMVGVAADIHRRKQAELAQQVSEARLSAIFNTASETILILNQLDKIQEVNPAASALFGYSKFELLDAHIRLLIYPEEEQDWLEHFTPLRLEGGLLPNLRMREKDGSECFVEVTITPYRIGDEKLILCIMRDTSERKRMQETMMQTEKMASLGVMASGIAHEINNPMQVITGVSQSLLERVKKESYSTADFQRYLEMLERNAWRVVDIVKSLNAYAHLDDEQFELLNINNITKTTLRLFQPQLKKWTSIEFNVTYNEEMPLFFCNEGQIGQVILNLLTNARDAMPNGGRLDIRTFYETDLPPHSCINDLDAEHKGDWVCLEASDTGKGIPVNIRDKIFDPFFTTKPVGVGTGLGLSILAGIIKTHHGHIILESETDKGTTFTLYFPVAPPLEAQGD